MASQPPGPGAAGAGGGAQPEPELLTQEELAQLREVEVGAWLDAACDAEMARITAESPGQRLLKLRPLNFGLERETKKGRERIVNRVELDTVFDFSRVKSLLTSPPVDCPAKPGYKACHVILLAPPSPVALIFTYLFADSVANDLARFRLINKAGAGALHVIRDAAVVQ